jgi:hypothetical protein
MNSLTKSLLEGLLEENSKIVALYGGGFKPPIGGHFEVVKEALKQYPEIDELIVLVGNKERNGISQSEAILIWEIYKNYLSPKINIQPSNSPIGDIYRFAKDNPQDTIYWVIGKREGADDDDKDIIDRSKELKNNPGKYNNLSLKIITTQDESMRGRNARIAAKKGKAYFIPFLPNILSKEDKNNIFDLVSPILNENATYSKDIDYKQMIVNLTNYMIKQGKNIEPLPKVKFINGDSKNAKNFLGKTAYYEPSTQTIVLYTEGRHPKDIVRSFSHEMVHHTQFLEDRLGDVSTTNTMEDDNINKLEQEANLKGTMTFRNWTDSLNENLTKNSNQIYHWTSYSACKKIIESNKLKSNESNQFFEYDESRDLPDYKNVVFFTIEDERFADKENSNQCILVVDKSKLSKDYKVISYGDPYEEVIVYTNDSFIPIFPYLKGVLLMNTLQKSGVKNLVQFLELKNIPYEINDNLEKQATAKKAMLPTLKKELINKLKSKYPNGFIGYLNSPLTSRQTPEYFKDNPTYSFPNITINKPGEYGEKNKFQIQFEIKPQNLEKYINWFMYSPDSIEDLINMDNYEGEELWLKGNIPIDPTTLQEANLKGTMTFRNWTDSLNENTTTNSYPFKVTDKTYDDEDNSLITVSYELTTPDNSYRVEFYSGEYRPEAKTFDLSFGVNTGDLNTIDTFQMTGEGNARKIFKTILNIVEDFINKEDVEKIVVDGTDEKRKRIYKAIFSSTPPNISDKIELKEAKNKDPFGLNQYARELAQGLEEAFLNEGKYTVYSDMDGVLVDFENRFKRFSKDIPPQKYEDKFGKEKFWDLIDNQIGVRFWAGMPWMSDGKQLWDYIKNYTPILLSSPSRSNSSRLGKRIWRKINLPSTKLILAQADKKQNYATPNSVLIDDRESNIDQWIKAGGIGILHTDTASTINKLKKLGL